MNIHTIHGRLVRDPELTQNDDPTKDRCKFTVAVDRRYGDETDFIDCVCFGKRAGVVNKFFHKGSEIAVTGEGQIRKYQGKDGTTKYAYSIVIADFDFCGPKAKTEEDTTEYREPPNAQTVFEDVSDVEADNPF